MTDALVHGVLAIAFVVIQIYREHRNRRWLKQDIEAELHRVNVRIGRHKEAQREQEQIFRDELAKMDAGLPL